MSANVLVIGSGGREHAICWKLSQSPEVQTLFVAPGNAGIAEVNKVQLVIDLKVNDNDAVVSWCKSHCIDLVVVGPEDPLARGITDTLQKAGLNCFGPGSRGARIEADKNWAKSFMQKHDIPTARWKAFTDAQAAKKFIREAPFRALVVKASGLAAGKGVIVANNQEEACKAVDDILSNKCFGEAGHTVVVEELLEGEEVSVLAFTDGKTVQPMLPSQDHKRHLDGDKGLNTGGMGAYCPCHLLSDSELACVTKNILQRTVDELAKENCPFVGVLYAGLMVTKEGPKVLEFNCRFGDPETQVILPLLNTDLYHIMQACCAGTLQKLQIEWQKETYAVGVVMASKGYPQSSSKGDVITGLNLPKCITFHSGTAIKNNAMVTNGGRVLIAVALASDLAMAAAQATKACSQISFPGAQYRSDIAHKGIARSMLYQGLLTYKQSGVDITAGDEFVKRIKPLVAQTHRVGEIGGLGGFGALFDVAAAGYRDPILVSGTDGVGTKLKIAQEMNIHNTIGIDLVAMCVNDILAHGAEPLFFLDYFASSHLDVDVAAQVVAGIAEGCRQAGCGLVGGETAEMPGLYAPGDYDLAGFTVGAVEKTKMLPRTQNIVAGDVVIGLSSSGVHSNGFSLVRKVLEKRGLKFHDSAPFSCSGKSLGEEFLTPTKIYVKSLLKVLQSGRVKALAHITGGGLTENIPRVLPPGLAVRLNAQKWNVLPVFAWLATMGGISESELLRTFNCGLGVILIVSAEHQSEVLANITEDSVSVVGCVEQCGSERDTSLVVVDNFVSVMEAAMKPYVPSLVKYHVPDRKRVGVLISGSGTNLQALIDATNDLNQGIGAEIVLVISNKAGVAGITRAENARIPTKVIKHGDFPSRLEFDMALHAALTNANIDIVCLAGFMRVLTAEFVKLWKGRLINIHPSLLPSFKGTHAHRQVLEAGVRVTGCTAHFVEADIDAGAILAQETVPVEIGDTEEILQERVKVAEHRVFPQALKLVATGTVQLNQEGKLVWQK
ncbi:hypothetical protein R5R35_001415 [Gryllus longicercus]|uniref:Trifunctional purine biosynthetic protein adenosine-3 n=1 Tax=Gryllus longicercus TaxID=2509291 RepID=A0AAN9VJS7_9ORTH